jgi:hypothetical protein
VFKEEEEEEEVQREQHRNTEDTQGICSHALSCVCSKRPPAPSRMTPAHTRSGS